MSAKRVSETGKNVSEDDMSSYALNEAATWADKLMEAEWQGRRDKENLVRYRLARKLGISESYLFRLQYKKSEMNDVKGSVYRTLRLAALAYGFVTEAAEDAYQHEKALANARNSKVAGLAAALAGPEIQRRLR